jgi:endoglucanase
VVGSLVPLGGPPVDVAGGWSDAGDYLKFVETASFVEDLLLYTIRQYPSALGAEEPKLIAEARYGLSWLGRMWNQQSGVLLYQVGIGDGNGRIVGDHDVGWRLPQTDETLRVTPGKGAYYVRYRPVFADGIGGTPISPNLAGRMAAAFGLCSQVFQASEPAFAHKCLLWGHGGNPYARFSGRGAAYEDNVLAEPSNEPSDDLVATALLAFAMEASE